MPIRTSASPIFVSASSMDLKFSCWLALSGPDLLSPFLESAVKLFTGSHALRARHRSIVSHRDRSRSELQYSTSEQGPTPIALWMRKTRRFELRKVAQSLDSFVRDAGVSEVEILQVFQRLQFLQRSVGHFAGDQLESKGSIGNWKFRSRPSVQSLNRNAGIALFGFGSSALNSRFPCQFWPIQPATARPFPGLDDFLGEQLRQPSDSSYAEHAPDNEYCDIHENRQVADNELA